MKIIDREQVIYKFEANLEPIAKVDDNSMIKVLTNDCFYQQVKTQADIISEIDFSRVNPATGPIYVNNAEVGDILKVDIIKIDIVGDGAIVALPGGGVLGDKVSGPKTEIVKIKDGYVNYLNIKEKIDPMIGVIGVSPGSLQEGVVTGTPGNHGGNLDTKDIRENTSIYFPVRETGAMLAIGDAHAIMGDGEVCVAGLEVSADITLKVSVIKNKTINWPILESETEFMVITSEETLEKAIYAGVSEMSDYVSKINNMTFEQAYMFNSMFVDYKISQVVNPKKTVRGVVSKKYVSMDKLLKVI